MPALLLEMRQDLRQYPLRREFVLLKRGMIYNGESLRYYYDDHPELDGALDILVNYGLVMNVTYNNAMRFRMSEELVQISRWVMHLPPNKSSDCVKTRLEKFARKSLAHI
jgi:hypothetical protein